MNAERRFNESFWRKVIAMALGAIVSVAFTGCDNPNLTRSFEEAPGGNYITTENPQVVDTTMVDPKSELPN